MLTVEELQVQLEQLRLRVAELAKGVGLQIGARGFRIGKLRLFHGNVSSGDDRLYQEESDGTQTDLTTAGSGGTRIQDADADTKVQTEKTTDDDTWRVDCAGNEELKCTDTQFTCTPNADFSGGVDVTGNITVTGTVDSVDVAAHHDRHDPHDGADALDCAAAGEIVGVAAAAEGSAHEFARADHAHAINHAITDNHLVTVDGTANAPVDDDYAKWTASGLEGMTYAQLRSDISVADGADVTGDNAPQAHGISVHTGHANWKVLYTDGSGDEQEVALGADGEVFTSTGAAGVPAFEAAGGGGGGDEIADADDDTKIQVEESADEDIIRMDVAGTERYHLKDSSIHHTLTGDVKITGGNLAVGADPVATKAAYLRLDDSGDVQSIIAAHAYLVYTGTRTSKRMAGVFGGSYYQGVSAGSCNYNYGLYFLASHNSTQPTTEMASIRTFMNSASTGAITAAYGCKLDANSWVGLGPTTGYGLSIGATVCKFNQAGSTGYGIHIAAQAPYPTSTWTGIRILDPNMGTGETAYHLELGTTPAMRLVAAWTAAANQTPLYLEYGATPTLGQVQYKDFDDLGSGDKVMILV